MSWFTPSGESPLTSKEAIIQAGLNWPVELKELKTIDDLPIEGFRAVMRGTDKSTLGVVRDRYRPVQNEDAFTFMDSLVASGEMKYQTAGSFSNGKKVWLLGKIGEFEPVPNDEVGKYLLFYNTHDGTGSLRALFTAIRVVCENTLRLALSQGKDEGLRLKHTVNIMNHLTEAKAILGLADKSFVKYEAEAKLLAGKQLDVKMFDSFLKQLFPDPPKDISPVRVERTRAKITELFESGKGQDIVNVSGTAWAAEAAIVEFVNYHKTVRGASDPQSRRLESSLLGTSATLIDTARQLLLAA